MNLLFGESSDDVLPAAVPHLSAHGVIAGSVTLGGGVGIAFDTGQEKVEGQRSEGPDTSVFFVGPRAGYLIPASRSVTIWLRGGVSYYYATVELRDEEINADIVFQQNGFFLALDPVLVFTPVPHVGLLLGPLVDIGLAGKFKTEQTIDSPFGGQTETFDGDISWNQFGVSAGIAALF